MRQHRLHRVLHSWCLLALIGHTGALVSDWIPRTSIRRWGGILSSRPASGGHMAVNGRVARFVVAVVAGILVCAGVGAAALVWSARETTKNVNGLRAELTARVTHCVGSAGAGRLARARTDGADPADQGRRPGRRRRGGRGRHAASPRLTGIATSPGSLAPTLTGLSRTSGHTTGGRSPRSRENPVSPQGYCSICADCCSPTPALQAGLSRPRTTWSLTVRQMAGPECGSGPYQ